MTLKQTLEEDEVPYRCAGAAKSEFKGAGVGECLASSRSMKKLCVAGGVGKWGSRRRGQRGCVCVCVCVRAGAGWIIQPGRVTLSEMGNNWWPGAEK